MRGSESTPGATLDDTGSFPSAVEAALDRAARVVATPPERWHVLPARPEDEQGAEHAVRTEPTRRREDR